jgi:hypothetical protein
MSIQELKREADALSDSERRELLGYLITRGGTRAADSRSASHRSADFLAWAQRPRPRIGLRDAGRDAIYED